MPDTLVKQHYIALVKLLKNYRSAPLDENILRATQLFCENLYASARANPDLIFAQPQLNKSQLPLIVNLSFNSAVLTCLIAVRNKFAPCVTIQLMCASISIYALEQSSIENHYQNTTNSQKSTYPKISLQNTVFIQLLKSKQQQIWLSCYPLCSHIHSRRYPRSRLTSPSVALVYMANKLAVLCTLKKRSQSISFTQTIKHLSLTCCPKWYTLLTPLLEYPSAIPVGSYVRLNNDNIHIVLSLSNKGLVTKPLVNKQGIESNTSMTGIQSTATENVTSVFPCQNLKGLSRLNHWWGTELKQWFSNNQAITQRTAFELTQPIQNAPASLLVIQDQLSHPNADITLVIKAIEKEPAYTQQLQLSASLMNRKQQPINTTQHGLTMLGFEQSNNLLLQYSLLSRLSQQYFPLQQALLSFTQFFANIAAELAARTKITSPESARTSAYFLVSRLFTLPSFRSLTLWQMSKAPKFKLASLVKLNSAQNLQNYGVMLAKTWQQNKLTLEVLGHYDLALNEQPKSPITYQYCYLLGVALILAQQHYFNNTTPCKETNRYFKNAINELGIKQSNVSNVMSEVISKSHISCPFF